MQIQVNTDDNIDGREALAERVQGEVTSALQRFRDLVTRVEVHLSDVNSGKSGADDKRCLIEVRLANRDPMVASHQADTIANATHGALNKLARALDSTLGRLRDRKGGESIRRDTGDTED